MSIINLTPHTINIILPDGKVDIPASGTVARVSSHVEEVGVIDGIPVVRTVYGFVEDLPDPQDGVIYVVSGLVAGRCPDRQDVYVPGQQVRDEEGRIVGCASLSRPS